MSSVDHASTDSEKKEDSSIVGQEVSHATDESTDEHRTLWQNVKKYRKVTYVTLGLTSAILLYGYDNVVIGTVSAMPEFQKDFGIFFDNAWILPSTWLAVWNVSSPVGAMFGALIGGWLQDLIGRRLALATSSFLSAVGVAIMFCSYLPSAITTRRVLFLVGKFFQGGAIGGVMACAQTYMSEILPKELRGSGMAFFPAFTLLGQLTGALVIFGSLGKEKGYRIAFGSQWPFSFVPIVVAFLVPESPTWLVRKGRIGDAEKAQARLDPVGVDSRLVVERLAAVIEAENRGQKAGFAECFKGTNTRRTLIVMWAASLPAVFGLALLAKASYFLQIVGMKASTSIVFLILGIVIGLLANVASIWIVARVGRRPLVVRSLVGAGALWLSMGVANSTERKDGVTWWTAASMMLTILVCGLGVWPASYAIAAETSSLHLRAQSQGIGWFVSAFTTAISGVVLPYVFNPDEGNLRGLTGYTYAASCVLGALVSWAVVPEMRGRSVGEIDGMFERGVGAREFGGWRAEDERMADSEM